MKRILIVDPDPVFTGALRRALADLAAGEVTTAVSLRDACVRLAGQAQDLAFIPLDLESEGLGQSLRTIQPDLRLVVMPNGVDFDLPAERRGQYQGILVKALWQADLTAVLDNAFRFPFRPDFAAGNGIAARARLAGQASADIVAILREAEPEGRLLATLLCQDDQVIAQNGRLNRRQATAVTLLTRAVPPTGSQLEFLQLPGESGDTLLYTRRVGPLRLTLVAEADESPGWLRRLADRLNTRLAPLWADDAPEPRHQTGRLSLQPPEPEPESFVLFWRPVERLPQTLRHPLRQAIRRLAAKNSISIKHLDVAPDHVHIVVVCPPGRRAAWAIRCFKSGTEAAIRHHFRVKVQLWRDGHYATPATDPLDQREIALFLAA